MSVPGSSLGAMPLVTPPPPSYQDVLNALPARDRPDRAPLPVIARVVWEKDGTEHVRRLATRWDPVDAAVFVRLDDPRCRFVGVWLKRDDVEVDR